eukprot:4711941-Alexandrium_andersonii.AAC.1
MAGTRWCGSQTCPIEGNCVQTSTSCVLRAPQTPRLAPPARKRHQSTSSTRNISPPGGGGG